MNKLINKVLLFPLAAAVLTSCAPLSVYYQEGAEVSRIDATLLDCRTSALAKVPEKLRKRYIPPVYTTRSYCYASGKCYYQRILLSPGYFETYDANQGLRSQVTDQCMFDEGFEIVEIPQCNLEVTQQTTIRATQVQPKLQDNSCSIRVEGGRYQIVNPADG
ncbi:MAG: hypothetical protein AAGF53_16010 [Pseudomonadota bacterium]